MTEPTDAERAAVDDLHRKHADAIEALWRAAQDLHRAYGRAADHGGNHGHLIEITELESEYARRKITLRLLRSNPKARP